MIDSLLAKVFGTKNEREVKAMLPIVDSITALEPAMRQLSDIDLAAKTIEFKEKLARGASLDDLLIEAFAVAASDPEIPGDQSSAEVERILHRKPSTLEQFMMDHRTTFQA